MIRCYLGLGSNLKSPERQLRQALTKIKKLPRCSLTQISSVYTNPAVGLKAQPNFCNMVVSLKTSLPPEKLLQYCQAIELKHQRIRKKKWGARTLDIDLLLYGDQKIHTPFLTIPHPQMLNRDFVMIPLLELSLSFAR